MLYCLDLDNTLVPDFALELASKDLGYHYQAEDHIRWDPFQFLPEALAHKVIEKWRDPEVMNTLPALPGARETLQRWKAAGHRNIIVTARPPHLEEGTKEMVSRLFGNSVEDTYVTGVGQDKLALLKELKPDAWIDDAPHQVTSCMFAGIHSILISNTHTRYNWGIWSTPGLRIRPSVAAIEDSDLIKRVLHL